MFKVGMKVIRKNFDGNVMGIHVNSVHKIEEVFTNIIEDGIIRDNRTAFKLEGFDDILFLSDNFEVSEDVSNK